MQIRAMASAMAVVCALHPIPNQGARHRRDLFSIALLIRPDEVLSCGSGLGRDRRMLRANRDHRGQGRSHMKCKLHWAESIGPASKACSTLVVCCCFYSWWRLPVERGSDVSSANAGRHGSARGAAARDQACGTCFAAIFKPNRLHVRVEQARTAIIFIVIVCHCAGAAG